MLQNLSSRYSTWKTTYSMSWRNSDQPTFRPLPFASAIFLAILMIVMDVSVADARNRLSELLRLAEAGENVLITRNGKPVARLVPVPPTRRVVRFGTMRGHIHLKPGWDAPIDIDQFLTGEF